MSSRIEFRTNSALLHPIKIIATNSASVIFTGLNSSRFLYIVDIYNYIPETDATRLYLRTSTDGVSFDSGASDYVYISEGLGTSTSTTKRTATASFIELNTFTAGTSSNEAFDFTIKLFDPSDANLKNILGITTGRSSSAEHIASWLGGARKATSAVTAIQFLSSSGNINGEFVLRGYLS